MSSTPSDLQGLRRRLDEIDDRLQDLLIDRAEIVSLVAVSKKNGDQAAFQPAREAEIIRRLVGRHRGAFPAATLVRMWREMLAATVRMQSPFSVAVFLTEDRQECWDLARDHYGSNTPMTAYDAAGRVIETVAGGKTALGILPMPRSGEADPWWPDLLVPGDAAPRVIARLPFGARGNARCVGDALVIGRSAPGESGSDRTLIAAEWTAESGRARFCGLLSSVGLTGALVAGCECRAGAADLIELEGFVAMSDTRLDGVCAGLGSALRRLSPVGGYAVPLPAAALTLED